MHQDIWENRVEPYIGNDKEIYIKLEMDPEAIEKVEQDSREGRMIGVVKA